MKCRVCRGPAVIDVRRHNANFCREHFLRLCRDQVARAIKQFDMLGPDDRVLVAVSGGKDSLALWDLLIELGYSADGFCIGLGIGDYSRQSTDYARRYALKRGLSLQTVDLLQTYGFDVPNGARASRRPACSACGLSKRHLFDDAARKGGYAAVATGHNLDDEAAVLFGNTLRWQSEYLGRQLPVLEARDGFPRKVKPLVRLSERETAAYCLLRGIDYIVEECPMAAGNKHLAYKAALNNIEAESPGTKHDFYFGFLERASDRFRDTGDGERPASALRKPGNSSEQRQGDTINRERSGLSPCESCGAPTDVGVCAFCRLVKRATTSQPVQVGTRPSSNRTRPPLY